MTADFGAAVSQQGLELWAGSNAIKGVHAQPSDIADVLLHKTANSWLRGRLDRSAALVPKLWKETPAEFAKRLGECVKDLNATCNVDALCRRFQDSLRELKKAQGDRLPP